MDKSDRAVLELREMDELAAMKSPVHSMHPLSKLIITIAYILVTVSFGKYDLSGLLVMVLYPLFVFSLSGIFVGTCFRKLRFVLPLVCAVGLFNPFFDRKVLFVIEVAGSQIPVTGGVISMLSLMLKGLFSVLSAYILIATTSIEEICYALRIIHVPKIIVIVIMLIYRYFGLMGAEADRITTAYMLRAPKQKGIHYSAWGSLVGQWLLRSMDIR